MGEGKSFEQNLRALEKIVEKLEGGSASLDESIRLFQKGKTLSQTCEQRLKEVELKIESLLEDEEGNLTTEPLEPAPEEEAPEEQP